MPEIGELTRPRRYRGEHRAKRVIAVPVRQVMVEVSRAIAEISLDDLWKVVTDHVDGKVDGTGPCPDCDAHGLCDIGAALVMDIEHTLGVQVVSAVAV